MLSHTRTIHICEIRSRCPCLHQSCCPCPFDRAVHLDVSLIPSSMLHAVSCRCAQLANVLSPPFRRIFAPLSRSPPHLHTHYTHYTQPAQQQRRGGQMPPRVKVPRVPSPSSGVWDHCSWCSYLLFLQCTVTKKRVLKSERRGEKLCTAVYKFIRLRHFITSALG